MTKTSDLSFTYGDHTLAFADIHPDSLGALIRRGMSHFLGNEQASKVVAWANSQAEAGLKAHKEANPDSASTVADFQPSDEAKAAKKAELQSAAIKAIREGSVGFRAAAPSIDPFDAMVEKIAKAQVLTVLAANGIKRPKAGEAVTFAGSSKTLDEMIETRKSHPKFKDAIEAEARKAIKAADAAKRKAAQEAEALKGASMEDLGL